MSLSSSIILSMPGSFIVFIHQSFEVSQRAIGFRAGQGWGEVIDDHRLRTPLGLGAFAGVIVDEGVDKKPNVVRFAAAVLRLSVVFLRATLIAIGKKLADANPKRNKPNNIIYIFPYTIIPK